MKHTQKNTSRWTSPAKYRWIINPIIQTLLSFTTVVWGAIASLFSREILAMTWLTLAFILFALLIFVCFAVTRWVSLSNNKLVIDSILTMPPHDFWDDYGDRFSEASRTIAVLSDEAYGLILDEEKNPDVLQRCKEDLQRNLRITLDALIKLTKKWDASNLQNHSIVYRANIMKAYYFDSISEQKMIELTDIADKFVFHPAMAHYSGYVTLESDVYTTTTASEHPEPDKQRKPIAFPFTLRGETHLDSPITTNLLGAPEALATNAYSYIPNVDSIVSHYQQSDTVDQRILQHLSDYYNRSKDIACSLLSIPIHSIDTNVRVNYVVNIYRNQEGLLFDGNKAKDFVSIVKPYIVELSRLLSIIDMFERYQADVLQQRNTTKSTMDINTMEEMS